MGISQDRKGMSVPQTLLPGKEAPHGSAEGLMEGSIFKQGLSG